jgi:succinate-semialdehyde dehydrogenase/glutarate-semialdehyde dehydrogenase
MPSACINPATEDLLPCPPDHSDAEMESMLRRSREAFVVWRDTAMGERARLMRQAAAVLRRDREALARLMTTEMGKPITAAGQEVDKCATACDWFADNAAKLLEPREIPSDASRSFVRFDPIGPVFAIMPWNFPLWQVFRFSAPTLMAGNTGLLKHAPNVPGCSAAVEKVFANARFPPGVFQSLRLSNEQAARAIADDAVAAVTLTGSTRAGRSVASTAGQAIKKTVLELGGSDPFIVIPPSGRASLEFLHEAAESAAKARCINGGQSCIAAKRFIVVGGWTDPFEQHLAATMLDMKIGDPMDPSTEIGPLARQDLLDNLHEQVQRTRAAGASLICGGRRLDGRGYFYSPTVLSDVTPGMPAFDEETFGPVAAVIAAEDVDHAIQLANQSPYGLGASIWTQDVALAEKIAPRIESGNVFINGMVKSDPRLPFGGVKQSGYGRELSSFGIHEFVNIKTVWIA